jgi:hypothetical protein
VIRNFSFILKNLLLAEKIARSGAGEENTQIHISEIQYSLYKKIH